MSAPLYFTFDPRETGKTLGKRKGMVWGMVVGDIIIEFKINRTQVKH